MIIEMNTETHEVREIPQESDANKNKTALEADVANIIATALVGTAVKSFKHDDVRETYIKMIALSAINMLKDAEVNEEC